MGYPDELNAVRDMGGRRRIADRRSHSTRYRFPERRWNRHRRSGADRRHSYSQQFFRGRERRLAFKTGIDYIA